jgi:hypothetical protein
MMCADQRANLKDTLGVAIPCWGAGCVPPAHCGDLRESGG